MTSAEKIDVVDTEDRPVKWVDLATCLRRGLLHRAIAVVVRRRDGRILIQQRSKKDPWQPGKLTLSCTGHVKAGESYEEAAERELKEELGLEADLVKIAKVLVPPVKSHGLIEREYVTLFTCRTDDTPRPDPKELEGVTDVGRAESIGLLRGRRLTPDSKFLLREYLGWTGLIV